MYKDFRRNILKQLHWFWLIVIIFQKNFWRDFKIWLRFYRFFSIEKNSYSFNFFLNIGTYKHFHSHIAGKRLSNYNFCRLQRMPVLIRVLFYDYFKLLQLRIVEFYLKKVSHFLSDFLWGKICMFYFSHFPNFDCWMIH